MQTEKVKKYIEGLLNKTNEASYQRLKPKELKEIRQALRNNQTLSLSF